MRKRISAVLLALCAASVQAEPTTQPASPMQEFIDRVPETLADESIKSYDVIATFGPNASPVVVRIRKTEPGKYSVYATCTGRHVPLFFGSDSEAFQYDPAMGVLRRFHNMNVELGVRCKNEDFTTQFNLHFQDKVPTTRPVPVNANIDFRSLMTSASQNVTTKTVGDYQVLTGHTRRGNPADFWIDPKQAYPLAAMALYIGNDPFFTFARIELNKPVDDRNMTMPSDKELAAVLPIKEIDGVFSMAAWQAGLVLSVMYELAIDDPKLRPGIEAKLGKIDWDKRIAADAEVNRRLIKLIGEQIPPDGRAK